jgi:hypothetical protein
MRKAILAGALALACAAGTAQAAVTINFTGGSGALPGDANIFENFDAFTAGASLGGTSVNAFASTDGVRPAYGSTGNFADVRSGGSYTINFAASKLFSFVVGSLDGYNTLTLTYESGGPSIFTGDEIIGGPSAFRDGVVTFRVNPGDALITGATFASSLNSFEFDNLASDVPEPAAWAMMIFGFALVGGSLRRRPTMKVNFA